MQSPKMTSRSGAAGIAQDHAAGGEGMRKMRTKSGELVTVSIAVMPSTSPSGGFNARLRFKMGGLTVQRTLGKIDANNDFSALKKAWTLIRSPGFIEKEGWSWEDAGHKNALSERDVP